MSRLRSRLARDVTVFTGLDSLTLPLLGRLAEIARNPRDVIVIEPDQSHVLLGEAALTVLASSSATRPPSACSGRSSPGCSAAR